MNERVRVKAIRERERVCRYPVGRRSVVVWHYINGPLDGLYLVNCSLYPDLGGMFFELEKATLRAQRIVSYHCRQLKLQFPISDDKLNSSKRV